MTIRVSLPNTQEEGFKGKLENGHLVKQNITKITDALFNSTNEVSIVYGDHENGKENYKILKNLLGIDKLGEKNLKVLQIVDKKIDENYIAEAFLLKIKGERGESFKNVTAIFETNGKEKILKHVHISEPRAINGDKVEELGIKKQFLKNKIGVGENISNEKGVDEKELKSSRLKGKNIINMNNPEEIAKSIMINFWGKALLLGSEEVTKLFSKEALLKGTVVQHLSLGDDEGIKDYFDHFCEKNPKLKIVDINANWLTKGKSILAKGEYLFTLTDKDGKVSEVPANFTMIFKEVNGRWKIDLLHSSIKYNKKELEKLNKNS